MFLPRCPIAPLVASLLAVSAVHADELPTSVWLSFRGNAALRGVAEVRLPDALRLQWTFEADQPIRSSPVLDEKHVYVGCDNHMVYAVDRRTGKQAWSFKTEGPVDAPPCVAEGVVYVGSVDTTLYALNAADGTLKWKHQTDDKIAGSANVVAAPDGKRKLVLLGSYDFKVYALDAGSGEVVWTYTTDNYVNGTPAVARGRVAFGGCDGALHVLNLADGRPVAKVELGSYIAGSGGIDGDVAYIGHYGNAFVAVDLVAKAILWTYEDRQFPYFSSPAIGVDRVVFGGRDRAVHCVRKADGTVIWRTPTRGKVDSSPVIAGDKVVVGSSDGRLYLLRLDSGAIVWSYDVGKPIQTSPAVVTGQVVIAADDGRVYSFTSPPQP